MALARPYDGLAAAWETGAGPVYQPLAVSLVQASPLALAGKLVLDLGSGTGAVAQAVTDDGARVVVADSSVGMAVHGFERGWPAIVADALALPVRDACFDAAMAGFLLNHLPPTAVLGEMARVVRPGGVLVASTWSAMHSDPVKLAIADVLRAWGWRPPTWYRKMKAEVEPVSGHPLRLMDATAQAGLVDVHAEVVGVGLGLDDPRAVVAYRLAMPHIAPWVARLSEPAASELIRQAGSAVAPHVPGWHPSVIQLTARVCAHPK